ncbi:glycoside hydrolase family 44-domain-containing protein [Cytidiella melzeri]|nr:glycoside hydrolase family 44-domain-containing protein [Cytidiella melzeri]
MLLKSQLALLAALAYSVRADQDIYVDNALSSGWENWSWGSTIDFAATDVAQGSSSISVVSTAYSALSLYDESVFGTAGFAGLKFDILGDNPDVSFYISSTTDNSQSPSIPISSVASYVNTSAWTTILLDFSALPPSGAPLANDTWNRINFQGGGNGASYHLDNIQLLTSIVVIPEIISAEPLASNTIAVTTVGAVNISSLAVTLNAKPVPVTSQSTFSPADTPSKTIWYLTLAQALVPGSLVISSEDVSFNYTLPAVSYGSITTGNSVPISPLIYGVNFPTSASYIKDLGVTISRWGGNAVTAYNPFLGVTNAGNDWYFENRVSDDGQADDWSGWVQGASSQAMITIPALDWVSKDSTSYSYPASIYPDQQSFDPYNSDAGDGLFPNGSYITPVPSQTRAYTPWNTTMAKTWLAGMANPPQIVTIDNEIEIASNTHQDMHPSPMGYDEELARVVNFSTIAKSALPSVKVAAPSTCAWWYYWTSSIGYTDNTAHNNIDFLPWFLAKMKAAETTAGNRLLDYLDIHYYYAPDTSANDAAAKALRLRMTRSLWDPSYIDESWIGTDTPQNHQPNANAVWLIPRMKALIAQNYPGTKLSISEWSSTADTDITGGLVAADVLGIFGREGVDSATYWATPDEEGPIGLAYWLYRGYGTYFPANSVQVNMADRNESILGVYAGADSSGKTITVVIVNKDVNPTGLYLANLPTGKYFMRHFGGQAGVAKWQTTITLTTNQYIVVPAYTSVFLQQQ